VRRDHEICRLDVARSSQPVWAKTSKDDRVFNVRMNNSTRAMPTAETAQYITDRWSDRTGTGTENATRVTSTRSRERARGTTKQGFGWSSVGRSNFRCTSLTVIGDIRRSQYGRLVSSINATTRCRPVRR
jgi:hypothetical protein